MCMVFTVLVFFCFLFSVCDRSMNLRIYRGQRYYADSGKRFRDHSNRRRAGVKCLGDFNDGLTHAVDQENLKPPSAIQ